MVERPQQPDVVGRPVVQIPSKIHDHKQHGAAHHRIGYRAEQGKRGNRTHPLIQEDAEEQKEKPVNQATEQVRGYIGKGVPAFVSPVPKLRKYRHQNDGERDKIEYFVVLHNLRILR